MHNCGIYVFQLILNDLTKDNITIETIKQRLKNFYKTRMIQTDLEKQFKKENKVWDDYDSVYDYILSDNYFISNIDITTLTYIFKIPLIVLLSKKNIKYEKNNTVVYNSSDEPLLGRYYIIRLGSKKKSKGEANKIELYESKPSILLFESLSFTPMFKEIMNLQNYNFSLFEKMLKN